MGARTTSVATPTPSVEECRGSENTPGKPPGRRSMPEMGPKSLVRCLRDSNVVESGREAIVLDFELELDDHGLLRVARDVGLELCQWTFRISGPTKES